jgi:imidazolonepropionase-like amidohydrolase
MTNDRSSIALALLTAAAALIGRTAVAGDTASGALAIMAARIYPAPAAPPIGDGVVLLQDGRISSVGPQSAVRIASDVERLTGCDGGVLVAGFQNSHVHFLGPGFSGAATRPPGELADALSRMLTRYGFTTVVDTGSDLVNTAALRKRVESGEVPGPRILTAGIPIFPENGIPFYLHDLPPALLQKLSQPATVDAAVAAVRANLDRGADATKLFVATPQGNRKVAYMSRDIARAAVRETHARGRLVVAHPTDNAGVQIAIDAGVDILAHTTLEYGPSIWPPGQTQAVVSHGMALVPTLELYPYELAKAQLDPRIVEAALGDAIEQVRGMAAAGGQVLFGTDVGYMSNYDPTDEYVYLARALSPMQILATLTTAPATRWQESARRGRVAAGMDADLVVLDGDPLEDVRAFAGVRCTLRQGRLVYRAPVQQAGARHGVGDE